MKKYFEEPNVEINKFEMMDVITTSNSSLDPDEGDRV